MSANPTTRGCRYRKLALFLPPSFSRDAFAVREIGARATVGDVFAHVLVPLSLRQVTVGPLTCTRGPRLWIHVPQIKRMVCARRSQGLSVRTEGHIGPKLVSSFSPWAFEKFSERLPTCYIPQSNCPVNARGSQDPSVRTEGDSTH